MQLTRGLVHGQDLFTRLPSELILEITEYAVGEGRGTYGLGFYTAKALSVQCRRLRSLLVPYVFRKLSYSSSEQLVDILECFSSEAHGYANCVM